MLIRLLPLPAALALAACATVPTLPAAPVEVGIVALNDFHGALEPPRQWVGTPDGHGGMAQVPAGGAAWLASAVEQLQAKHAHHLTVAAGDLISASPLASSLYLDEPAVGVMNRIGLDFAAVGNHEFDRGRKELLRIQNGGCDKNTLRQPCALEPFTGAQYRYLAASTLTEDGTPLFPATGLKSFGDGARRVTVGFIGLTLKGTAEIVEPDGIRGLTFADEAQTINTLVPRLKERGADAIVVLIHQGGLQEPDTDPNGCTGFSGDIRPILDQLDTRVDLVVSGHTHRAYVCDYSTLNPARLFLLTSAGNNGKLVTDIALTIDPAAHRVVAKTARNVIVQSAPYEGARGPVANTALVPQFAPRADVAAYVERYVAATREFSGRPVGAIAQSASGRVLGQVIADSQLAATRGAGAQIALMNPGGVRAALVPQAGGALTFGDIYAVQPFGNTLVTQTLTGAELRQTIEQSLAATGDPRNAIPSAGLAYSFDMTRPAGSRVVSLTFDGKPVDPAARFRVTTNSFLASGGDGYAALKVTRDVTQGGVDLDALEAWLKAVPPRAVPTALRAVDLNAPAVVAEH
ncbi:MAG: bifunctional metallophosphatase/5'-nucleotidase [Croceibacterium sp.]